MSDSGAYTPAPGSTPPVPPPYPADAAPAPKKKPKGWLIAAGVVLLLLILTCCGGSAVLFALSRPAESDVTYSEADFGSAVAKLELQWPELPEGADPDEYERVYSGEKPMDVTLTEAELWALLSYNHNSSYWPIKNMAVDLTGGNNASVSGVVSYAGRDWPVGASGSGTIAGSTLDVELTSAEVLGFDVPAEYLPVGADFLENVVNPRLARAGITVDTMSVGEEGVRVIGTTWATAEYVPVP